MDAILLLIAINFLSVPFLQEAEAQGHRLRRFPHLLHILRLAHVRKSRWLLSFCAFTVFLFVLVVARGQGAGIDGQVLALHAGIIQSVLWTVVWLNLRRQARPEHSQQTSVDAKRHSTTGVAPLLTQP